jgi:hypothetical protein
VTAHPDTQVWLPLGEAASRLGLSRHQLRRRVRAGQLASRQVQGPHGLAYEVCLDPDATVASGLRHPDDRNGDATATVTPPLAELVSLVRDTQAELVRTAAAAAMWQARAEHLGAQVEQLQRALPAPTLTEEPLGGPSATSVSEPTREPSKNGLGRWWRALRGQPAG